MTAEAPERLLLRLCVEVEDEARAVELLEQVIRPTLEPHADVQERPVERYWKIPEWFELTLDLEPLHDAAAAFERVLALAEGGWTRSEDPLDPDGVWNHSPGLHFLAPEVRWAHLQRLRWDGAGG